MTVKKHALVTLLAGTLAGNIMASEQIDSAKRLLQSFESGDPSALELIDENTYLQHNVNFPSGRDALVPFFSGKPTGIEVDTIRAFEDGDRVVLHSVYGGAWNQGTPQVAFDIFRFDNGKIQEHWDNLQNLAPPNPSGHTQTDGHAEVSDIDNTAVNRQLVEEFVNTVLVKGNFDELPRFYAADLVQHNSSVGDGIDGLMAALSYMAENDINMRYDTVHHVLAQGNFVLTVAEGEFAHKPTAFYDLFRVADGMIVEHWDILETLDENAHRSDDVGKF